MTSSATSPSSTTQSSTAKPFGATSIAAGATNTSSSLAQSPTAIPSMLKPAYATTPSANSLMNLYGSFAAPAQTQQLSPTGGR
jgi:hypothetical protein